MLFSFVQVQIFYNDTFWKRSSKTSFCPDGHLQVLFRYSAILPSRPCGVQVSKFLTNSSVIGFMQNVATLRFYAMFWSVKVYKHKVDQFLI